MLGEAAELACVLEGLSVEWPIVGDPEFLRPGWDGELLKPGCFVVELPKAGSGSSMLLRGTPEGWLPPTPDVC